MEKSEVFQFNLLLSIQILVISIATLPAQPQKFLPEDDTGWSILTPSPESRILYVSSSEGDDESAKYYNYEDAEIGENPEMPVGNVLAYSTIAAAVNNSRQDQPDWILLKRGDVWYEPLKLKNGPSPAAPFVVGSYGEGNERPLLKTGEQTGVNQCCHAYHNIAINGIHFYAHTRDPNSLEYAGPEGNTGFNFYVNEDEEGKNVLIEDCLFRFYTNNVVQGPGIITNIIIRRNLFLDNYSHNSHSQGMYTNNIQSMLLEENFFDHNGWLIQSINSDNIQDSGQATIYNHNTYFANGHNISFISNVFLRASSIGTKWTANDGEASTSNIILDNNLYVEGEIGISMGGNQSEPPHRFKNIRAANNVMLDIGRGRPTNRSLGWYLEINDWDGGLISRNLFIHQRTAEVTNVYALNLIGETRDVSILENVIYGLNSNGYLIRIAEGSTKANISLQNNAIQSPSGNVRLVQTDSDISNYVFVANQYYSDRVENQWFNLGGNSLNLNGWIEETSEANSSNIPINYPEPNRTIESYMENQGKEASFSAFITEIRSQSKYNWKPQYTAIAVNNYLREGFDLEPTSIEKKMKKKPLESKRKNREKFYTADGKAYLIHSISHQAKKTRPNYAPIYK